MRFLLAIILSCFAVNADACIAIGECHDEPLLLRNFDYPIGGTDGYGVLFHNPKGFMRQVIRIDDEDNLLTWKSRHSSITINLLAPGIAQDGMNDAGLVGTMAVIHTRIHKNIPNPSIPTLNEMEVLQYVLDQAADIQEVVKLFIDTDAPVVAGSSFKETTPKIRMTKVSRLESPNGEVNFHWAFCDKNGLAAEINYVNAGWEIDVMDANDLLMCNEDTDLLEIKYTRVPEDMLPLPQEEVGHNAAIRYMNGRFFREYKEKLQQEVALSQPAAFCNGVICSIQDREEITLKFHHLDRSTSTSWNKWQVLYKPADMCFYYRTAAARKIKKVCVGEILTALDKNKTSTGCSLHTAFTGPVNATDFAVVNPKLSIYDVITAMNQSPKLCARLYNHCRTLERFNEQGLSFEAFQKRMPEKNSVATSRLVGECPTWHRKAGVYAKIIASESYYKVAGCNN